MMDEHYVRLLARVMAQEVVLTATTVRLYRLLARLGVPFDLEAERESLKSAYATMVVPGVEAAASDVLASDLAHEIDSLLADIAQRVHRQG